jgi:hypothetical protein
MGANGLRFKPTVSEGEIMPRATKTKDDRIFQLKVTLNGSKPPIWRRVQVRADTRLGDLHAILQAVMGWDDSHLHQFIVEGEYYGVPTDDDFDEMMDEDKFTLTQVVGGEKSKIVYEYDFGDGWMHDMVVEKILPPDRGAKLPMCIDGQRACPPEDCGGLWGFYDLLETVRDPKHPEHDELSEWLGDEYDPEAFDLDGINGLLSQVHKQPRIWRMLG